MRHVLLAGYTDKGGAGIAMINLFQALQNHKPESIKVSLWIEWKTTKKPFYSPSSPWKRLFAIIRSALDEKIVQLKYPQHIQDFFSFQIGKLPDFNHKTLKQLQPSLLHVHWINTGALQLKHYNDFPIFWTLHDLWAFTGGCPHPYQQCDKFQFHCGNCPLLNSKKKKDLAYKRFKQKQKLYKRIKRLFFITPSRWLKQQVMKSALWNNYPIKAIPNTLDVQWFAPYPKEVKSFLRRLWRFPEERFIVLIGAPYRHKATITKAPLQKFIELLWDTPSLAQQLHFVFLGHIPSMPSLPTSASFIDSIQDIYTMALLYNAVDCYLHFSLYDNLPNMIMEALACGVPCLGFAIGGIPEMIQHKKNGFITTANDLEKWITYLQLLLQDSKFYLQLSEQARAHVLTHFAPQIVAKKHWEYYQAAF